MHEKWTCWVSYDVLGYSQNSADYSALPLPQLELIDTGESNTVGGSGAQDPRWERIGFFILLCCVEKDAPELGDTLVAYFRRYFGNVL